MMKKGIYLSAALLAGCLVAACGGNGESGDATEVGVTKNAAPAMWVPENGTGDTGIPLTPEPRIEQPQLTSQEAAQIPDSSETAAETDGNI